MISILCPTRGRPDLAKKMYESALDTAEGEVEILFGADEDDPKLKDYAVPLSVFPKGRVSTIWNVLCSTIHGDIVLLGNDDLVFQTKGWDKEVEEAMPKESPRLVWCNDGINGDKHAAFPFVNKKWIESLGYYLPEVFNFLYHDTWLFDIAKKAGCSTYLNNVMIEHRHFSVGKAEFDDTYKQHREGVQDKRQEDGFIFQATEWFRSKDANTLKRFL